MIKIEIEGFNDLMTFIKLFKSADDEQIKTITEELNKASDDLIKAEKKDEKNAGTSSH
jgi:hypothetical protein